MGKSLAGVMVTQLMSCILHNNSKTILGAISGGFRALP